MRENGKDALVRDRSGKEARFSESFLSQNYLVQIEGHVHRRRSATGLTTIHKTIYPHKKDKNQDECLNHPTIIQEVLTSDASWFPR